MALEQNTNGGSDIIFNPDSTSSIGKIGMPAEESSYQRYKFFYDQIVTSKAQLAEIVDYVHGFNFTYPGTRISGRMVMEAGYINELKRIGYPYIETVSSLEGTGNLDECLLVYLGKNALWRTSPSNTVVDQYAVAVDTFQHPKPNRPLPETFTIKGLSLEERMTPALINAYYSLYQPFSWDIGDVEELLGKESNVIVAAFSSKGELASSALAELATIPLRAGNQIIPFRIAEITEAATAVKHQGKGLYQVTSDGLLLMLAHEHDPDYTYGELNLDAKGVLNVAATQRRNSAVETAVRFGIPHAFYLDQHVTISQSKNNNDRIGTRNRYNNLMVASLSRQSLQQLHGTI